MSTATFCFEGSAVEQLQSFGWNDYFEAHFHDKTQKGFCPARVASDFGESFRLLTEHGELNGELAGRLRYLAASRKDLPAVGDWVMVKPVLREMKAVIHGILPRKSCFARTEAGLRSREQIIAAKYRYCADSCCAQQRFQS